MKIFFTLCALFFFGAVAYCQLPDTVYLSAQQSLPAFSHIQTVKNTEYLIEVQGRISYWRDSLSQDSLDADGACVFHIPYLSKYSTSFIDSVNTELGSVPGQEFAFLPCNRSFCQCVPVQFGCNPGLVQHDSVPGSHALYLDKDYLSAGDSGTIPEFCPRTGGDPTTNTYWEGIMGTGHSMEYQIHDGDGDFVHNSGTLTIILMRLQPIFGINQSVLNFGQVTVHPTNPPVKPDTITNLGSPTFPCASGNLPGLQIRQVSDSGDLATTPGGDGFTIMNLSTNSTLDTTIPQSVQLGFSVSFNPLQKRPYLAKVYFTTSDPQDSNFVLILIGNGVKGLLSTNPSDTIDFGDVPLNKVDTNKVQFINVGTDVLKVLGIYANAPNPTDPEFFPEPNLISNLGVGQVVPLPFTFAPQQLGEDSASVSIETDSYNGAFDTLYLRGRGVAALLVTHDTLNFGTIPVNDTVYDSLPLTNAGNITFSVQLSKFDTVGDTLDFSAKPLDTVNIAPSSSFSWNMSFTPHAPGLRYAYAEIQAQGGGAPKRIYCFGYGIVFSAMTLNNALNYGNVSIDTDSVQNIVIHSTGNIPIKIDSLYLDDTTVWAYGSITDSTIAPKDSLVLPVTFSPRIQQAYQTTLHLSDDSGRQYSVLLSGNGERFIGVMNVPDTLNFGQVVVGDTDTLEMPISNVGNAQLALVNMGFAPPGSPLDFSAAPTIPLRLSAGASDSIPAYFTPLSVGVQTASFEISDSNAGKNDGIQHVRDVVFYGNGLPPITAVLAVDTNLGARVGEQVTIPVNLESDITPAAAANYTMNLKFDGTLLLPLSASTGALTNGWQIAMNDVSSGNVTITSTGTTPLTGTGSIANVTYLVLSSASKSTSIDITSPSMGTGKNPRYIQTINGLFSVTGQCGSDVFTNADVTQLQQNNPNPFATTTVIPYRVTLPAHVTISIYDVLGRKITTLVDQDQPDGQYSVPFDASQLAGGVYFCRMNAGQYTSTRAMTMMK